MHRSHNKCDIYFRSFQPKCLVIMINILSVLDRWINFFLRLWDFCFVFLSRVNRQLPVISALFVAFLAGFESSLSILFAANGQTGSGKRLGRRFVHFDDFDFERLVRQLRMQRQLLLTLKDVATLRAFEICTPDLQRKISIVRSKNEIRRK